MGKGGAKCGSRHEAFAQCLNYTMEDADADGSPSKSESAREVTANANAGVLKKGMSMRSSMPLNTEMSKLRIDADKGVDGGLLDYPEVLMLMQELENKVAALESIGAAAIAGGENGGEGGLPPPQDRDGGAAVTVKVTPEQLRALKGLGSSIKGLVRCLDHRHQKEMLTAAAEGAEKKKDDPPPPRKPKRPSKSLVRRATLQSVSDIEDKDVDDKSAVPRELLASMMLSTGSADGERVAAAAAYLANEYGGTQLPKRYTIPASRPRGLKAMAKAMANANAFIGQARAHGNVGIDELEYLPQEFSRLGGIQRKKLARLLSWEGLREWGLDIFAVDRLSTVTLFRKSMSLRGAAALQASLAPAKERAGMERAATEDPRSLERKALEDPDNGMETSERGCPLVLVGWAILASPYAQLAMAINIEDQELIDAATSAIRQRSNTNKGAMSKRCLERLEQSGRDLGTATGGGNGGGGEEDGWNGGYFLPDEFEVSPRAVARFLRRVEREYSPGSVNPYHNNVHAADVTHTTHALIQMGGRAMEMAYTPLETYAILMAAVCHDMGHPGTNNNYQVNKGTRMALRYNDNSVLENMHASKASCLIAGVCDEAGGGGGGGGGTEKILGAMTKEQQVTFRKNIICAILNTDMKSHFSSIKAMTERVGAVEGEIAAEEAAAADSARTSSSRSFLDRVGGGKHPDLRAEFLPFVLHLADISNPAKPPDISMDWTECVYDEFFLQGDKEANEDMPVSPLCDRSKTCMAEAQVGFMTYVVRPAYALLARCVPKVGETVMSQLNENMEYWTAERAKICEEGHGA